MHVSSGGVARQRTTSPFPFPDTIENPRESLPTDALCDSNLVSTNEDERRKKICRKIIDHPRSRFVAYDLRVSRERRLEYDHPPREFISESAIITIREQSGSCLAANSERIRRF